MAEVGPWEAVWLPPQPLVDFLATRKVQLCLWHHDATTRSLVTLAGVLQWWVAQSVEVPWLQRKPPEGKPLWAHVHHSCNPPGRALACHTWHNCVFRVDMMHACMDTAFGLALVFAPGRRSNTLCRAAWCVDVTEKGKSWQHSLNSNHSLDLQMPTEKWTGEDETRKQRDRLTAGIDKESTNM